MAWRVDVGDASERLREMPDRSVQCCVTSPPYFGLRDYGTGEWEGGEDSCDHKGPPQQSEASTLLGNGHGGDKRLSPALQAQSQPYRDACGKCGARRVDRQLGLEPTPDEYVARLVEVFREVRRVLRDDGTLWLNIGDSYNQRSVARPSSHQGGLGFDNESIRRSWADGTKLGLTRLSLTSGGLKEKDLLGIPWMLAFALRADGWYLRSDVIWAKPNPMPESVTDRPTSAHEHLFLLAKSSRYFYDADAIRETSDWGRVNNPDWQYQRAETNVRKGAGNRNAVDGGFTAWQPEQGRNKRNVWEITTQPYAEAHFATFPPKLVEPCVLAGSRPVGALIEPEYIDTPTGEPAGDDPSLLTGRAGMNRPRGESEGSRRITVAEQRAYADQLRQSPHRLAMEAEAGPAFAHYLRTDASGARPVSPPLLERWIQRGWLVRSQPPAATAATAATAVVLDPFAGSGTVGVVCGWHGRDFIGIELNPEYAEMARRRIESEGRLGRRAHRPESRQTEALF